MFLSELFFDNKRLVLLAESLFSWRRILDNSDNHQLNQSLQNNNDLIARCKVFKRVKALLENQKQVNIKIDIEALHDRLLIAPISHRFKYYNRNELSHITESEHELLLIKNAIERNSFTVRKIMGTASRISRYISLFGARGIVHLFKYSVQKLKYRYT